MKKQLITLLVLPLLWAVHSKPLSVFDKNFGIQVDYFEKTVTFQQKIKLKTKQVTVKGKLEYMACTKEQCLPPDAINFSIPIN